MSNQKFSYVSRTITPDNKHQTPQYLHLIIENEVGLMRELSIKIDNSISGSFGWSLWQHALNHTYGHSALDGSERITEINILFEAGRLPIGVIERFLNTNASKIAPLFTPPTPFAPFPTKEPLQTIEEVDAEVEGRWVDDREVMEFYDNMSEGDWVQMQIDLQS